jgi:hypothetical protein
LLPTVVSMFPFAFGCYPLLSEGSNCARDTHPIGTLEKMLSEQGSVQ